MQKLPSKLNDFYPPWERKLFDIVENPEIPSFLRGNVDFSESSGVENFVRDGAPLAQDAFRSCVIRQIGIKRTL